MIGETFGENWLEKNLNSSKSVKVLNANNWRSFNIRTTVQQLYSRVWLLFSKLKPKMFCITITFKSITVMTIVDWANNVNELYNID